MQLGCPGLRSAGRQRRQPAGRERYADVGLGNCALGGPVNGRRCTGSSSRAVRACLPGGRLGQRPAHECGVRCRALPRARRCRREAELLDRRSVGAPAGELRPKPGRRSGRQARFVVWRHGSRKTPGDPTASMRSRFLTLRVRPANRNIPRGSDGSLPECRLLAEWPPGEPEPTDYWLSTLPADTRLRDLVRLAKIRWRIEHDYRELKDGLGLDHFEGRSWLGWHCHVTLTPSPKPSAPSSAAPQKPPRRPDPLRSPARTPDPARHLDRRLPHLPTTHPDPNTTTETPAQPHLTKHS